ncbi:hypothetical protein bcgnr5378_66800 [Bacillus cereus]
MEMDSRVRKCLVKVWNGNIQNHLFMGEYMQFLDNAYTNTTSDSWQDDRGAKRTRTITINSDNVTIELKSERNNTAEGKGIVSHKAQLTKTS